MMRMMIVTAVLLSENGFLLVASWSLCNLWLLQHLDGRIRCVNKQKVPRLMLLATKFPEQRKTWLHGWVAKSLAAPARPTLCTFVESWRSFQNIWVPLLRPVCANNRKASCYVVFRDVH